MTSEPSRQAQWAKAKREARGPLPKGRPPKFTCPNCSGHQCRVTGSGDNRKRKCVVCEPAGPKGRPSIA